MNNFKTIAQDVLSQSHIIKGREKISTKDVIGTKITLVGFDILENGKDKKPYAVFALAEHPDRYLNGGELLTRIAMGWASNYPDIKTASDALETSGGVAVRLTSKMTADGKRNITSVDIL